MNPASAASPPRWSRPISYLSLGVFLAAAFACLALYRVVHFFRPPSTRRRLALLARWCRWGCPWLGLSVRVEGAATSDNCLYVSNHRSYLDIPVLTGVLGATFLGRGDVAGWPLVGTVARLTEAVLVRRDDNGNRARAALSISRRLRTTSVVVFPEGTTTGERLPGRFHSGVFRLVQKLDVAVVPVTVRYSDRRAYWVEELGLGQHLTQSVFPAQPLRVAVHLGKPLYGRDFADAAALLAATRAAIGAPIETEGELA